MLYVVVPAGQIVFTYELHFNAVWAWPVLSALPCLVVVDGCGPPGMCQ